MLRAGSRFPSRHASGLGPELVVNGDFGTGDLTSWTIEATATSPSVSGGQATVTSGGASNVLVYQSIALVVGKTYQVKASRIAGLLGIYVGAAGGTSTYAGLGSVSASVDTNYTFVATSTSAFVSAMCGGALGTTTFDNISVRQLLSS